MGQYGFKACPRLLDTLYDWCQESSSWPSWSMSNKMCATMILICQKWGLKIDEKEATVNIFSSLCSRRTIHLLHHLPDRPMLRVKDIGWQQYLTGSLLTKSKSVCSVNTIIAQISMQYSVDFTCYLPRNNYWKTPFRGLISLGRLQRKWHHLQIKPFTQHRFSFHHNLYPWLLGDQGKCRVKASTHDRCQDSNHRPLDLGFNALTTQDGSYMHT
jgi:hypothetical protein